MNLLFSIDISFVNLRMPRKNSVDCLELAKQAFPEGRFSPGQWGDVRCDDCGVELRAVGASRFGVTLERHMSSEGHRVASSVPPPNESVSAETALSRFFQSPPQTRALTDEVRQARYNEFREQLADEMTIWSCAVCARLGFGANYISKEYGDENEGELSQFRLQASDSQIEVVTHVKFQNSMFHLLPRLRSRSNIEDQMLRYMQLLR